MTTFLQLAVAGLIFGGVYALLSLGLVLTYRVSRVINIAYGALGVLSAYVYYHLLISLFRVPVPAAFGVTIAFGALLGAGVERWIVRPTVPQGSLSTLVALVGLLLLLTDGVVQIWGIQQHAIPTVFPDQPIHIGAVTVTGHQIGTLVIAVTLAIGLSAAFRRTRFGLAVEAVAEDREGALAIGLPVPLITSVTWALAGGMAALAALLYIRLNFLDPISLTFVLINSLVAAIVARMSSFRIAAVSSVVLGIAYSLAQGYLRQSGIAAAIIFVTLIGYLVAQAYMAGRPGSSGIPVTDQNWE